LFRGITVSILNLVLIIPITLAFASHNSGAIPQDVVSAKSSNIVNVSTVHTRLAIINFDDGYKSQFTNTKPILYHLT
jgi:hypothetical protein